jgi:hypothetical protein
MSSAIRHSRQPACEFDDRGPVDPENVPEGEDAVVQNSLGQPDRSARLMNEPLDAASQGLSKGIRSHIEDALPAFPTVRS